MIYGQKCEFYDLICINYHKYANEWIFQKFGFYTLHLTCMQIFAAIGGETAEILGGGGVKLTPPPPVKTWSEIAQLK